MTHVGMVNKRDLSWLRIRLDSAKVIASSNQ
jgi:hypothetical protein